jgi:hypothetical protein
MKHVLLIVSLSVALILSGSQRLASQTTNSASLAGSWQLTLSTISATVRAAAPTRGLATFTADGSLVETDSAEASPVAVTARGASAESPGHGIWQPGPALGTYYAQFINLLVTPNGVFQGKKTVTITVTLDATGNHFAGSYQYQTTGPAGEITGNGSGAITGDRMVHPLLP